MNREISASLRRRLLEELDMSRELEDGEILERAGTAVQCPAGEDQSSAGIVLLHPQIGCTAGADRGQ